eukprot:CAMPEP_0172514484 /NCGR_PEP_ID=MMETSP1066-20121228/260396_1 /TAXON_ID=671091 /ORGANISM="Coscinodiscus wailesii, Strain CCMP2513" /LENGTH=415 /DNA_ID=CAMNT_0013295173 /DNA_START=213 /DNA_END=1460 /DNA_ORIENTATION=-
MADQKFVNASETGEIPSFNGSDKAKATDFANYFCSYAQLYHQKQMLADHNRMAAYHSAIIGNSDVFKDKVVMDVGTGSGILAVWAAQAGAKRVYAIEYTDMAKHAISVMEANNVSHIVKVIQAAVEDIDYLCDEDRDEGDSHSVDIIISEWMGYFLLRESMLDTIIRARDRFLKKGVGLMFPSHATMYFAPVCDEDERKQISAEYTAAMGDWAEFAESTMCTYGVNMSVLENEYEREQKEYYLLSSRWSELNPDVLLAEPAVIKFLDMCTCTIEESRGISADAYFNQFEFDVNGSQQNGPISAFAGWFTVDFKSRTDQEGKDAPKLSNPALLSTGPENGYTHWGQQVFYLQSPLPLIKEQTTTLKGLIEMTRSKENARLYNCRITYECSRRKNSEPKGGHVMMKSAKVENVYQIP